MASRREHSYAILNLINRGPASDDNRISERLVTHMMSAARAILLKRKMDKERIISDSNFQTICVPLVKGSYADCPNCNLPKINCVVMKSTYSLPSPITTRWGASYRVRKIDGTIIPPYNQTNIKYKEYSSAPEDRIGFLLQGSKLLIIGNTNIPLVIVEAVFEFPEKLEELDPCKDLESQLEPCSMLDNEFPIDPDLVMPMYELTLKMLGYANQFREDTLNNSLQDAQVSQQGVSARTQE